MSTTPLPSAIDLLKSAKEHVMKRGKFFMAVVAIPAAVSLFASLLMNMGTGTALVGGVLMLVSLVLYVYSSVVLIMSMEQETMTDWRAAFRASRGKIVPYIWTSIMVGIVVMIGTLFLVLPGIYLSVLLGFYAFASILEGKRGWDAAQRSKELVNGRWWQVFCRWFAVGLIVGIAYSIIAGIAGMIDETYVLPVVDFVLTLVVTPLTVAVSYLIYKHLKMNPMMVSQAPTSPVQGQPMA